MKRNFVVSLFGSLMGFGMLFVLLSAAGVVGARGADAPRDQAGPDSVSAAMPLTSTFTYQGQLKDGGTAVNGSCQMAFRLYDAVSSGSLVGSPINTTVPVTNGLFTVGLNFGSSAFDGNGRWLDIQVNCGSGFVALTPRQAVTAAPYSIYAMSTGALQGYPVTTTAPGSGQVLKWNGSAWVPGLDAGGTAYSAGFGLTLIGSQFNVVTSTIQQRVSSSCSAGNAIRVVNADGSVTCEPVSGGGGWGLTGNASTNPSTNFLGTTDNVTLTFRVNNTAALRIVPNATSPNIIGGFSENFISSTVVGSVIGGGGLSGAPNRVQGNFGMVGGGQYNSASADNATVGGGYGKTASAVSGDSPTVGGGYQNIANGDAATVGGGWGNNASSSTTIAGGFFNTASANAATVSGGALNAASGDHASVGGGNQNTASGIGSTIGGGGYDGTTITGNQAVGNASTIGGGLGNSIPVTGTSATIGGGWNNTASNAWATVGGGLFNTAGREATVAGGQGNTASSQWATVGGGWNNSNNGYLGTLGGGSGNIVSGTQATLSGGAGNIASGQQATVGGGLGNTAGGAGAFVGGGGYDGTSTAGNQALGGGATIGGGIGNAIPIAGKKAFIGGGEGNTASGFGATIGGGVSNIASGVDAMVPGGAANLAQGNGSFAAGWQAKANNTGCFVWADFTGSALNCNRDNAFYVRASGGITLYTNSGATIGAALAPGSGSWSVVSDRNLKENFTPVDSRDILARLAAVPMQTWNYTTQDASIRHIGPMAQDFAAAFHVDENDTTISAVDAQGVALAAIQGLYQENQDLKAQNASLAARMTNLEQNTQPAAFNWFNLIGLVALALSGLTLFGVRRQLKRGGRA